MCKWDKIYIYEVRERENKEEKMRWLKGFIVAKKERGEKEDRVLKKIGNGLR